MTNTHSAGTLAGSCAKVAAQHAADAAERLGVALGPTSGAPAEQVAALGVALDVLVLARRALEAAEADTVAAMRTRDASWQTIGDALGVSKQAAAKRFGEKRPAHVEPGPSLLDLEGVL